MIPKTHYIDVWVPTRSVEDSELLTSDYNKATTGILGHWQPVTAPEKIKMGIDQTMRMGKLFLPPTAPDIEADTVLAIREYRGGAPIGDVVYWNAMGPSDTHSELSGKRHHLELLLTANPSPHDDIKADYA